MSSPEKSVPVPTEADAEGHSVLERDSVREVNSMSLQIGNLLATPGMNDGVARMLGTSDVSPYVTNIFLGSHKELEEACNGVAQKIADVLKVSKQLSPGSPESAALRDAIDDVMKIGGLDAALALDKRISDKLPKDMTLRFSSDKKINDFMRGAFPKENEPVPDFVRWAVLVQKLGENEEQVLGFEVALAVRSPAQKIAMSLSRFDKDNPMMRTDGEAAAIATEIQARLKIGGTDLADKFAAEINRNLPSGIEIKITDNKDFRQIVDDTIKEHRKTDPNYPDADYVRLIQLVQKKDNKEESLGNFGITWTDPAKVKPQARPKARTPLPSRNLT